ncbi:MAG: M56 family metallopeptidase [Thermoanaerobaculia bacterium]
MTGLVLTLLVQGTVVGAAALVASRMLRRYPPGLRIAILALGIGSFLVPLKVATRAHAGAVASPSWILMVLGLVAAAGAAAGLVRLAIEALALRRLVARTMPAGADLQRRARELAGRDVRVRLTADCDVPFVASADLIVLPASMRDFDDERIDGILLHEIAHIRGGDVAMNRLLALFAALLWFDPVARLLVRALRDALEERCDDFALRHAEAHGYAETLVELAASLRSGSLSAAMSMASGETRALSARLRRIAEHERQVTSIGRCVLALVLVAAPLLIAAAQITPSFVVTDDIRHSRRHAHGGP